MYKVRKERRKDIGCDVRKKYKRIFRETIQKIIFRRKLRQMDKWWYYMGGNNWGLFPPSFYYTHTEEEVERIATETIAEIQELINRLKGN